MQEARCSVDEAGVVPVEQAGGAPWMERALQISCELTTTTSVALLLRRIVEAAAELTDSESAGILLQNGNASELHFVAATSFADQLVDIPVPVDASIAGAAFREGRPVHSPDVHRDARYYAAVERQTGFAARSLLAVPLQFKNRRIGVLEVQNKRQGAFDATDVQKLTALGAQATVAIENVRMVQALQQAHDTLEQRVAERVAELSAANETLQDQISERERVEQLLRERTAELEARNEELDAFAHTVAHDLRGPLTAMIGLVEMMADRLTNFTIAQQYEYLGLAGQVGHKMNNIIDEILCLASVRDEEIEADPLDMAQIVAAAWTRLDSLVAEHQAEIVMPDDWPVALGHAPWVEQVWVNYLSNALKYGDRPPHIELGANAQPDGTVRFWVADNGPGLAPEEQTRLFRPFTRLDQVRAEGHGLGLSIVCRIVERLGGQVGVESTPGQGSVFSFTLPADCEM